MLDLTPEALIAISAVGSGVLISLAVTLAYRLGRDRGMRTRSERFDRLYVEADFSETQWAVFDTSEANSLVAMGNITLRQTGTRLLAEGIDADQCRWSAEGVVFRRGAHLLFVERRDRGHAVGSLHLQLDPSGQSMTGMKSTWEGDNIGGMIQTVTWNRVLTGAMRQAQRDVEIMHHSIATEANRQHV